MERLNGFDNLSAVYDQLAYLVFGSSIKTAQRHFLDLIPADARILILGGGTGWLLKEIADLRPSCVIWYIEASEKMIALSKQKTGLKTNVHFLHGTESNIPASIQFDVVITNFYLDLFKDGMMIDVIEKIKCSLKPNSFWLATDFVEQGKWWQKIMLKIMYAFFGLVSNVEDKTLPDWNVLLNECGLKSVDSKLFFKDFIKSSLFKLVSLRGLEKQFFLKEV